MSKIAYAVALLALAGLAFSAPADPLVCTEHELLSQSTPACPITCQTRHMVHCLGLKLSPSCQCVSGYLRNSATGKCVPLAECPASPVVNEEEYAEILPVVPIAPVTPEEREKIRASCDPETEHFQESAPACPARCANGRLVLARCLAILNHPSCQCQADFVRDSTTQKCIPRTACQLPVTA